MKRRVSSSRCSRESCSGQSSSAVSGGRFAGSSSESPALLFAGSLFLRTTITVAGFYFVSHGNWRRLLACLLGLSLRALL